MIGDEAMKEIHIYNLIAYRDGVKETLCTYRGDDTGLYNFQVERVNGKTLGSCCGDDGNDGCTCG